MGWDGWYSEEIKLVKKVARIVVALQDRVGHDPDLAVAICRRGQCGLGGQFDLAAAIAYGREGGKA